MWPVKASPTAAGHIRAKRIMVSLLPPPVCVFFFFLHLFFSNFPLYVATLPQRHDESEFYSAPFPLKIRFKELTFPIISARRRFPPLTANCTPPRERGDVVGPLTRTLKYPYSLSRN